VRGKIRRCGCWCICRCSSWYGRRHWCRPRRVAAILVDVVILDSIRSIVGGSLRPIVAAAIIDIIRDVWARQKAPRCCRLIELMIVVGRWAIAVVGEVTARHTSAVFVHNAQLPILAAVAASAAIEVRLITVLDPVDAIGRGRLHRRRWCGFRSWFCRRRR
jgi:hypothetical protein